MRYATKPERPDPLGAWHLHFAWWPVKFDRFTQPDNAVFEVVLRRRRKSLLGDPFGYIYDHAPREWAAQYPHQYGIGVRP